MKMSMKLLLRIYGPVMTWIGRSDLRLEGVVTDEGHQRVLFHMDTFFPVQAGF